MQVLERAGRRSYGVRIAERSLVAIVVVCVLAASALLVDHDSPARAAAAEPAVLVHPEGAAGDSFGWDVDTDGSRVVVGAPYHDELSPYVFKDIGSMSAYSGASWDHETTVSCTNTNPLGEMYARWFCGYSVAVEGDTTLMGAPQMPNDPLGELKVYGGVVETDWSGADLVHQFTYGYQSTSFYGAAVDIAQGQRLLGAPWTRYWVDDEPVEMVGEARIVGSDWLEAPAPTEGLEFGWSVGIDDDLAVVASKGAVYVFRDAGGWVVVQELPHPTDEWLAVALDDGVLVVGSRLESSPRGGTGIAVVYEWDGSAFAEVQTLWADDGAEGDWFGRAVAIDGERIAVGAPDHGAGAAYVYASDGASWQLEEKLTAPIGEAGDWFGWSVAVHGTVIAVGAPHDDNAAGNDAGAAYVFDLDAASPPPPTTTTLPPGDHDGTFIDDDDSIFEADIEWLAASGITKGCNPPENTMYCPDRAVTRGQMAAFLVRAMGYLDDGGGGLFVDTVGSVFAADIDKLATAGVTKGCNPPANDRYCPDRAVTRGQMAAFLVRAMGYLDDGGGGLFVDTVGSVFVADIDKLATAGVTKGCNPPANDRYCPDRAVTRGQMAAFLHRAMG